MTTPVEFPELLRLIDERSAAFRDAVASAPSLDVRVPSCPEWTLFRLVEHLGGGDRFWAAVVAAGPTDAPSAEAAATRATVEAPRERDALVAWLADSTRALIDALREAGPERGCWTWWGASRTPRHSGGVARHRVQETAVHTYDAQLALGTPRPLPKATALDGVDEFLNTCVATTSAWPHKPAVLDFHATEGEGRTWRLTLDADGARPGGAPGTADVSVHGTASDLVLFLYNRVPETSLRIDGDRGILDLLRDWEPEE
ncbi:maleylpyruvate isomerase family mycothiol-dependent enzyme [Streptomyces antibioticus]|uniref:maleylpyruvate isomerase family mycothiol-dependent enzyme n=1 Tax=Streptomyces antibioticus TaxID=1890 RepID=UPI0036C0BF17